MFHSGHGYVTLKQKNFPFLSFCFTNKSIHREANILERKSNLWKSQCSLFSSFLHLKKGNRWKAFKKRCERCWNPVCSAIKQEVKSSHPTVFCIRRMIPALTKITSRYTFRFSDSKGFLILHLLLRLNSRGLSSFSEIPC